MEKKPKGKVNLPPVGQIGVVVKDLDKAMKYYTETFGMGPWKVVQLDFPEVEVRGKKHPWKVKVAFTSLGPVEFELIDVVEGRSIHSEFLDEGREGLHHLGFFVTAEEKERIIQDAAKAGIGVIQGGKSQHHSGSYAYLDSDKTGGIMFELINRPPDYK